MSPPHPPLKSFLSVEFASSLLQASLLAPSSPPLSLPPLISTIVFSNPLRGRGKASRKGGAAPGSATVCKLDLCHFRLCWKPEKNVVSEETWPNWSSYFRLRSFRNVPSCPSLSSISERLDKGARLLRGSGEGEDGARLGVGKACVSTTVNINLY